MYARKSLRKFQSHATDMIPSSQDRQRNSLDDEKSTYEEKQCVRCITNERYRVTFMSEQKIFGEEKWVPPAESGLRNSEPIIPSYYLQAVEDLFDEEGRPVEYMNIDYLTIIKDDIRNFRKLNKYQIRYIKAHVSDEVRNEIIDEFIKITNILIDIIYGT